MNGMSGRHERVLLLGALPPADQIVRQIERGGGAIVVGVVDDAPTALPSGCVLLGPISRLADIVSAVRPDRVIVALRERRGRTPVRALVEACIARGVIVEEAAQYLERQIGKLAIESLTPATIVFSSGFGPSRRQRVAARVVSLLIAAAGLVALFPLLALIAIAVKLDSAGPVLFVQDRVGMHGRIFRLLKFRTMHPATAKRSEWECDNLDRLTRIGKWLRAFRLDELPQFINVVRGDMNLIGPRPHPASNFELFTLVARNLNELTGSAIGYYSLRTMVRPGITGWAQVRYRYANDLDEEIEKLRYDLYYVKYASAMLDFRILAATFRVLLAGRPASTPVAGTWAGPTPAAPLCLSAGVNQTNAA